MQYIKMAAVSVKESRSDVRMCSVAQETVHTSTHNKAVLESLKTIHMYIRTLSHVNNFYLCWVDSDTSACLD